MDSGFKDWTVEKSIGEGAFGKVYKIVREDFGHTYEAALKLIEIPQSQAEVDSLVNEGFSEQEIDDYFRSMVEDIVEEFTLMSKLKGNSNIVSYEDHAVVKKEDGFGWRIHIRMELLTGLFTHAKSVDFTNKDIIRLGIDICKALEVCQKYNIIHRDIKPENIFISDVGTYKLGDFGIARELEKTSSGLSKKGTKSYMAPEVYKGMEYNSTVDLYSLGIVLYRFLNDNRLPFLPPMPERIRYSDKETADVMRMSGQPMPAPVHASEELAEIVLKACAYVPTERYSSAKEMREDLERVLQSEEEKIVLECKDMNAKNTGTGNTLEATSSPKDAKKISSLEENTLESTTLSTYEETDAETTVMTEKEGVHQVKTGENVSRKNKRALGSFLIFLLVGAAGVGIYSLLGNEKDKSNVTKVTASPSSTTLEVTNEPTQVPTATPTKRPKKTKRPEKTEQPVTKAPIVTTEKPVTKTPTVTKVPEVTKKPERTKKPESQSQIIIDDPNVTVE